MIPSKKEEKHMRRFGFTLISMFLVLAAYPLYGVTYYVGNCKAGAYRTIQTAVDSVSSGSTLAICPGTYSEQVVISKDLTLAGIVNKNSSKAVITMPANGLAATSSILFGTVAAQVEVTAGTVNISNITVNGSASTNCPNGYYVGIFYRDASGTLNGVETRNQNCNSQGAGALAENGADTVQSVAIENSAILDSSYQGIIACSSATQPTLTADIRDNFVAVKGAGIVSSGVGANGGGGVAATVSRNTIDSNDGVVIATPSATVSGNTIIASSGTGIFVDYGGTDVVVSGNNVTIKQEFSVGINTYGARTNIKSNHVFYAGSGSNFGAGIWLNNIDITVQANVVANFGAGIEFFCSTGEAAGNIINAAAIGINNAPDTVTGVNTFYNVGTDRTVCAEEVR
jgi:trimeric autotransporter adhesin